MLTVENLSVRYGAVQALRDVSLSVGSGESLLRSSAPTAPASRPSSTR